MDDIILYNGNAFEVGPTKFDVTPEDIDGEDTFDSEDGHTNSNVIRKSKYSIDIEYRNLTSSQFETIMSYIADEKIYIDFYYGTMVTGDFKPTGKKTNMVLLNKDRYGTINNAYWNLSFILKEY